MHLNLSVYKNAYKLSATTPFSVLLDLLFEFLTSLQIS